MKKVTKKTGKAWLWIGIILIIVCFAAMPGKDARTQETAKTTTFATNANFRSTTKVVDLTSLTSNTTTKEVTTSEKLSTKQTKMTTIQGPTVTYILNTNTLKFHFQRCSSAKKIKEENKKIYTGSREALLQQGYSPCGNCHP